MSTSNDQYKAVVWQSMTSWNRPFHETTIATTLKKLLPSAKLKKANILFNRVSFMPQSDFVDLVVTLYPLQTLLKMVEGTAPPCL
jgi:hypothetical protein